MSFTGNEDHSISLTDAAALTENYRDNNVGAVKGHFFGKTAIQDILDQADCVGIRIYYGENASGDKKLVLVGAKANEDDLENGELAQFGIDCPSRCGNNNALNS